MNKSKVKTILALTGTLLIGFVLGMLVTVQIHHAQMKKFRSFASREGFGNWTLHVVNPSPEQREKMMPVIKKYAAQNLELRKKYRNEFINLMKNYRKDLYPLLTPEQINRLESLSRARKGHPKRGMKKHPSAPGNMSPPERHGNRPPGPGLPFAW